MPGNVRSWIKTYLLGLIAGFALGLAPYFIEPLGAVTEGSYAGLSRIMPMIAARPAIGFVIPIVLFLFLVLIVYLLLPLFRSSFGVSEERAHALFRAFLAFLSGMITAYILLVVGLGLTIMFSRPAFF